MTAARRGRRQETNSRTKVFRERTSGTTALRIHGSSSEGGTNWQELPGLREHGSGPKWQPGAGGMCLHTIILDPSNPQRIFIAISAAGAFRSDDGGETWRPINRGLHSQY